MNEGYTTNNENLLQEKSQEYVATLSDVLHSQETNIENMVTNLMTKSSLKTKNKDNVPDRRTSLRRDLIHQNLENKLFKYMKKPTVKFSHNKGARKFSHDYILNKKNSNDLITNAVIQNIPEDILMEQSDQDNCNNTNEGLIVKKKNKITVNFNEQETLIKRAVREYL